MNIDWRDFPQGSTAEHEGYRLSVMTETFGEPADGYRWIAGIDYASEPVEDPCIMLQPGLASREAAKEAVRTRLEEVLLLAKMEDREFVELVARAVAKVGDLEIQRRAHIGSIRVNRWARGERLPIRPLRGRAVIALRALL